MVNVNVYAYVFVALALLAIPTIHWYTYMYTNYKAKLWFHNSIHTYTHSKNEHMTNEWPRNECFENFNILSIHYTNTGQSSHMRNRKDEAREVSKTNLIWRQNIVIVQPTQQKHQREWISTQCQSIKWNKWLYGYNL